MTNVFRVRGKMVFLLITAGIIAAVSCSKQSEDVLIARQGTTLCDTTNMKFSANVVPILTANCYSCHANGIVNAGVTLDSYNAVLQVVTDGRLVGAITHAPGYVPMPYGGGQLSDCDIAMIKAWIDEGAPNN